MRTGLNSVNVVEPMTGDEIFIRVAENEVILSLMDESGSWMAVSLGPESAAEVAASLEAFVRDTRSGLAGTAVTDARRRVPY